MNVLITSIVLLLITFINCSANYQINKRQKRQAYVLSSGWNELIKSVNPIFKCESNGYFADIANGCQLYHVCESTFSQKGKSANFRHYSFVCGEGTVFNQLTFTCTRVEESIPCESSANFYYLNERIGDPNAYFLTEGDIALAKRLPMHPRPSPTPPPSRPRPRPPLPRPSLSQPQPQPRPRPRLRLLTDDDELLRLDN